MTIDTGPKSKDGGLELDAIDALKIPAGKPDKPAPRSVRAPDQPDPAPLKTTPDRKHLYVGLALAIALLVVAAAFAAFFSKQDLSFSFLSGTSSGASEQYLRVGPINATLPNNDIIKFSLDIGCRDDSEKKRLAEKDSLLRNQIVAVITAPGVEKLFEEQKYDEIKSQIRESLEKIGKDPVGEIYFSELRIY